MSMIRWEPFDEMMSMRESMDRLFEDFFSRRPRTSGPLVSRTSRRRCAVGRR